MKNPLVSIITVVYNDPEGLERTIKSVIAQDFSDYEYIVIDGGSTDSTKEIIKKYSEFISFWISENDNGIYDAMNKGIEVAKGNWLNFMNAGDTFADHLVLSNVKHCFFEDVDLLYGDKLSKRKIETPFPVSYLKKGIIFSCHQSMFFRKKEYRYNLRYKIYSDYDYVCKYYKNSPSSIRYIDVVIADFEGGGVSSKVSFQKRLDKYRIVYENFGIRGVVESLCYRLKK